MRRLQLLVSFFLLSCAAAPAMRPAEAPAVRPRDEVSQQVLAVRRKTSRPLPPPARSGQLPAAIPGLVEADLQVRCDVRAVQGSAEQGRLDPGLWFLRDQLRRPPLSRYKRLSQISRSQLQLTQRVPQVVALGQDYQLELTLLERVPWLPRRERYRLRLASWPASRPAAAVEAQLVTLHPGKITVVQSSAGEDLLLLLTCRPAARARR